MNELVRALAEIEKNSKSGDAAKIEAALKSARQSLAGAKNDVLKQLNEELSVWQQKIGVILKEPVGRDGMAKHARHWIKKLEGMDLK